MEPDLSRDSLSRSVRAVLDGVAETLAEGVSDRAHCLFVLQAFGDGLRASAPLPAEVRRWIRHGSDAALSAALQLLTNEVSTWTRPGVGEPSPTLAFALRRRDEAESALAALAWRAVTTPPGTALSRDLDALEGALHDYDRELGARCTRSTVEALLGDRVHLDDRGWRAGFPADPSAAEISLDEDAVTPGPEFVDAWIREGRFHHYVQRQADRDPAFAETLRTLVEGALQDLRGDSSLPVGFVARRWLQSRSPAVARPSLVAEVLPQRRLAAASEVSAAPTATVHLGLLAPLAASARIDSDGDTATLRVYAREGALASVTWGDTQATAPSDGEDAWAVTIPVSAESATVVVTATNGEALAFDVALSPTDPTRRA